MTKKKIYLSKTDMYNNATRMLAKQVRFMELPYKFRAQYNMPAMVYKFRAAFRNSVVRQDALCSLFESERCKSGRFAAGFCGIASYTWSHLFRMPNGAEIWRLKVYRGNYYVPGLTDHVWLENKFDGSILDLTFDQSVDEFGKFVEIPYFLGEYADSDFEFARAYKFAEHLGIDLKSIVFENALRRALHGRL